MQHGYPAPHSRAGDRSRSLPVGSLRRRLRDTRSVRPRRQHQSSRTFCRSRSPPPDRARPRRELYEPRRSWPTDARHGRPATPACTCPIFTDPRSAVLCSAGTASHFLTAARIWVAASLLVFAGCVYLVWRSLPSLRLHPGMVALCAIAFPPLFHFFVRGQISAARARVFHRRFLAFRADRDWLAGIALGFLVFKPQFLVAIPLVLLLRRRGRPSPDSCLRGRTVGTRRNLLRSRRDARVLRHALAHVTRDRPART